ncbi:MAG TPA: hypothetical protein VH879_01290 [Gemmatimonadales bacterium]
MRGSLLGLGLILSLPVGAGQAPGPSYHPLQVDCARYRQEIRSVIRLQSSRQRSRETSGRTGFMVLRATQRDSLLSLEAWFDSLSVWREGAGERLEPETDGVIGGRFKGLLTGRGAFTAVDRPFVPDEVAEVSDVGDALGELLPPLAPVALIPGAAWKDDFGTVITRIADGRLAGQPVERYRLVRHSTRTESRLLPDSTAVSATRRESEAGTYDWSNELGPLRWEREITADVEVPAGGPVKSPFRTQIEQMVTVERVGTGCGAP